MVERLVAKSTHSDHSHELLHRSSLWAPWSCRAIPGPGGDDPPARVVFQTHAACNRRGRQAKAPPDPEAQSTHLARKTKRIAKALEIPL